MENLIQNIQFPVIQDVFNKLNQSIDFEESIRLNEMYIKDGYDALLDHHR